MKVVSVTGGGQGIGRGVALHFANAGYAVAVADADRAAAEEVAQMVKSMGRHAMAVEADVADEASVADFTSRTIRELDVPDVHIANAGINHRAPFLELRPADFDRVIATNLRGVFLTSQAAARAMVGRGHGGAIVTLASTRAFMSEPDTESYAASKGGILALTHAMAISLGPHRIRVNAICPGWIETRHMQRSDRAKTADHSREDCEQHPVGRVGDPTDVAEACLFLAEKAGFMTGQHLVIDGGMTVKMIYAE